ncbi:PLAC8 family-domain-containing protein [Globomyces pollinis-pini]|nr:PLAC8 family-domain-containing protein [Globomyces pollinis-pini]
MSQPQMNVDLPFKKSETGTFENGLFGCFSNIGTCCLATFCPCVVYGQNQAALQNGEGCFLNGLIYTVVAALGCQSCLGAYGRGQVRDARGLDGEFCGDCITHYCCTPCALTQEHAELELAGAL